MPDGAESKDLGDVVLPMLLGTFNHLSPHRPEMPRSFPGAENPSTKNLLASCYAGLAQT